MIVNSYSLKNVQTCLIVAALVAVSIVFLAAKSVDFRLDDEMVFPYLAVPSVVLITTAFSVMRNRSRSQVGMLNMAPLGSLLILLVFGEIFLSGGGLLIFLTPLLIYPFYIGFLAALKMSKG